MICGRADISLDGTQQEQSCCSAIQGGAAIGEPLAVQALWQTSVKTCSEMARAGAPVLPGRAGSSMLSRIPHRAPCHVIEDHIHIDVHLMLTALPHHVSKG